MEEVWIKPEPTDIKPTAYFHIKSEDGISIVETRPWPPTVTSISEAESAAVTIKSENTFDDFDCIPSTESIALQLTNDEKQNSVAKLVLQTHQRIHGGENGFVCNDVISCAVKPEPLTVTSTTESEFETVSIKSEITLGDFECRPSDNTALDNEFDCDECGAKCASKSSLQIHERTHASEIGLICECGKKFNRKQDLTRHKSFQCDINPHKQTPEKQFACDECGMKFTRKYSIKLHKVIHTGEKLFSCDECGKIFRRKNNLDIHLRSHSGEKPFSCDECGKRFNRKDKLNIHLLSHSGEKPFHCDVCGKRYTQKCKLKAHKRTHSGEKPLSCDICGMGFAQRRPLKSHLLRHAAGANPTTCDLCGRKFSQKHHLKSHMLTHTGEKPFSCDECGSKFATKSALRQHDKFNASLKPVSCDVCGKGSFTQKCTLRVHKLTHTDEKPFSCDVCDKRFANRFTLKTHKATHTGEKSATRYTRNEQKKLHIGESIVKEEPETIIP